MCRSTQRWPDPEDRLWTEAQRRYVRELRMFSVRQPWSLLLSAHRTFDENGFSDILRAISVISFRYNVIGNLLTNEQERIYNDVARQIARGLLATPSEVIRALAPIYVEDEAFRIAFAEKILRTTSSRNKQITRYILFALEHQISGKDFDTETPKYTIEHILPENPKEGWEEFTDNQIDEAIYRLGNFTLLEDSLNRQNGNQPFQVKQKLYRQSIFQITNHIAEQNESWTMDRLACSSTMDGPPSHGHLATFSIINKVRSFTHPLSN